MQEQLQRVFSDSGRAGEAADGPWHPVVECHFGERNNGVGRVADEAGHRLHWSGIRHPQTQGKVERFHGEMERAIRRRGWQGKPQQQWLDEFRWEHNQVRPHEALADAHAGRGVAAESASVTTRSPPRWEYPAAAQVRRLDADGKMNAYGRTWNIGQGLRREWVQLLRLGDRVQVFYCRTVVRELDLATQRSTSVERWIAD